MGYDHHDHHGHGYGWGAAAAVIVVIIIIIIIVALFAGFNNGAHGFVVAGRADDDTTAVRTADLRALCAQLH